jgi:CheY-like chemotaxis protein
VDHYLLVIFGFCLAALIYWGSERRARGITFHILWIAGVILIFASLILYQSITFFDQDLKSFPLYRIVILAGIGLLIISRLLTIIQGKSAVYAELAEEKQQRAISEITQLAASSGSLVELLNFAVDRIISILGMSGGAIHIFHAARQSLVLGSYMGLSARMARRLETLGLEDTAIGRTIRNKRLLIIRNLRLSQDYELFGGKADGFTHMALIPIVSDGEHWGVVTIFGRGPYKPGKLRVDLLEQFGEQLGVALVLGRKMRNTSTSLENARSFISSMGDELIVTSKLSGTGKGVIRGIAWALTRILGGDRFDLAEKSAEGWIVSLSSEPEAVGQQLNINDELEIDIENLPSGLVGWDQGPPFREFAERRSYAFCALPDKKSTLFIRMETRRRSTVDFEFFYDACKILHGLSLRLADEDQLTKSPEPARHKLSLKKRPQPSAAQADIGERFEKIGVDLGKLIEDYSGIGGDPEMKSLISWLELIRDSAYEGKNAAFSATTPDKAETARASSKPAVKNAKPDEIATDKGEKRGSVSGPELVRILAVDSQDVIRDLLASMLAGLGYDSVVVGRSDEAIEEFRNGQNNGRAFNIVISDNVLDNITGLELSVKLKEIDPRARFVLISGWGQEPETWEIENSGVDRVLKKPFRIEQLSEIIAELLRETRSA